MTSEKAETLFDESYSSPSPTGRTGPGGRWANALGPLPCTFRSRWVHLAADVTIRQFKFSLIKANIINLPCTGLKRLPSVRPCLLPSRPFSGSVTVLGGSRRCEGVTIEGKSDDREKTTQTYCVRIICSFFRQQGKHAPALGDLFARILSAVFVRIRDGR